MTPAAMTALKAAVEASSQTAVAARLDCSKTTVSMVLAGKYGKSTAAFERRVREVLAAEVAAAEAAASRQWLDVLRAEAQRVGQARLALRLDIAESTLSQVLSGTYKAATTRIERRVRGVLLGEEVDCRALWGLIPMQYCQSIQEGPKPSLANPPKYHAWMSCRGMGRWDEAGPCPHFNCGASKPAAPATPSKEEA